MAMHADIRNAVAEVVRDLGLVDRDRVNTQDVPDTTYCDLPAIIVSYSAPEKAVGGTNERADFQYPVLIGLYDIGKPNTGSRTGPDAMEFRDTMRRTFHEQKPFAAAVPVVYNCEVNPQPVIDTKLPQFEKLVTAVEVLATARVTRG